MTNLTFEGRSALVTGAASGIGAACARWLDRQGASKLWLIDRDGDRHIDHVELVDGFHTQFRKADHFGMFDGL